MECKLSRNVTVPLRYRGAEAEITFRIELEKDEKDEYCIMFLVGIKVEKKFKDGDYLKIEATQNKMEITINRIKIKIEMPEILKYSENTALDFFVCSDDLYREGLESVIDAFLEEVKINVENAIKPVLFKLFDIDLEKLKCEPSIDNAREIKIEKSQ